MVHARNTLLNTFVFYQALAWMGRSVGDTVTAFEASGEIGAARWRDFLRVLGDVEIDVRDRDGAWVRAGSFSEIGPIAREVQLAPLGDDLRARLPAGPVRARLRLGKGSWKIDRVGLAELLPDAKPRALALEQVHNATGHSAHGEPDPRALARLSSAGDPLVTMPGDRYWLRFTGASPDDELFLESRGWYYEWMRKEWLAEENRAALLGFLADPSGGLRRMAPAYKKVEREMESAFWSSRFGGRP